MLILKIKRCPKGRAKIDGTKSYLGSCIIAQLVAKCFTQKDVIDYKKTFSSVFRKDSFKIILTLMTYFDIELHQMDVQTIFINSVTLKNKFV